MRQMKAITLWHRDLWGAVRRLLASASALSFKYLCKKKQNSLLPIKRQKNEILQNSLSKLIYTALNE